MTARVEVPVPELSAVARTGPGTGAGPVGRGSPWPRRRGTAMGALAAAATVLALSVPGIGDRAMWNDEYATWYASTLRPGDLIRLAQHVDAVVAPYYAVMHVWISVFGDSETSLRMPSALAMAAAAALLTLLGARLLHPVAGIGAGLAFAVLPAVTRFAQEARPYGFAVAATVLSTVLLARAVERPTGRRWLGYAGATALAGLAHVVALLVLVPHLVVVVGVGRARHDFRLWRWTGAVAGVVTVALPLVAAGSTESDAIGWIRANSQAVGQLPARLTGSAPAAGVLVVLAALTVALLWRPQRTIVLGLLTWGLGPVLLTYVTFPVLHLFLYRYLLFTVPAWCLLAGALGYALARRITPSRPAVLAALLTAVLVAGVAYAGWPGQATAHRSPVAGEPDFRAAADVVRAGMRPGDGIAYAWTVRNGRRALAYELRATPAPRDVFLATASSVLGTFGAAECAEPGRCVRDTGRIWLILTDETEAAPYDQMPVAIAHLLHDEFSVGRRWVLSDVTVILLTRVG